MHRIGIAGLLGIAVSQREIHCLHGHQRKQLRSPVVCAGRRLDEQRDDGPHLGVIGYGRIEQIADAASAEIDGDGAELRGRRCRDLVVRVGKDDTEQLQRFERQDDALVVSATGLIDLDAQAVDPGAVEIRARIAQHQLEQPVRRIEPADQVFTLGESKIEL